MGDDEEVMGFHITDQDMEESLRPGGYRRRKWSKVNFVSGEFLNQKEASDASGDEGGGGG